MAPGNKKLRFEHDRSLKVNLKQYNVKIFGEDPLEISQLVEKLIRKLLMVFYMYRRRWKRKSQGFCPEQVSGG